MIFIALQFSCLILASTFSLHLPRSHSFGWCAAVQLFSKADVPSSVIHFYTVLSLLLLPWSDHSTPLKLQLYTSLFPGYLFSYCLLYTQVVPDMPPCIYVSFARTRALHHSYIIYLCRLKTFSEIRSQLLSKFWVAYIIPWYYYILSLTSQLQTSPLVPIKSLRNLLFPTFSPFLCRRH